MKEGIALVSIFVNLFLAVGKLIIGFLTGSVSVLAEGIHSGMDVFSSGISFIGIKFSKKPEDKKHPYGYYKYEVLSGTIITLMLFLTGLWILYKSYKGFIKPEIISLSYLAVGIMIISAIANEIVARFKIHYGKKENSISLLSVGVHDRVDVYTSIVVLIGLFIMPYWVYIDSILSALIGIYIIKESIELGKEATDSLLDKKADDEIEDKIKNILKENEITLGNLKTQKRGSVISANIEIELPPDLNVEKATKISEKIKKDLIKEIDVLEYVAIQIKSYDITDSYFQSKDVVSKIILRKGFGWSKRGKFKGENFGAQGKGPGGNCICPKCGYTIKHKKETPCLKVKCPNCHIFMRRK